MLIIFAGVLSIFTIISLLHSAQLGILFALFSKPIIDATFDRNIMGINLLEIFGVIFPIVIFLLSFHAPVKWLDVPLANIWTIFFIYFVITFSFGLFSERSSLWTVEAILRMLNGLAGYYMLQAFFRDRKSIRRLLIFTMAAGLFPMLTGLYQAFTGIVWHERLTVGMMRNVGMYHHALIIVFLSFQTITGILLYWCYFAEKKFNWQKLILAIYFIICVLVIYKALSKAAILTMVLWSVIWAVSYRRAVLIIGLAVVASLALAIDSDIAVLFSKESAAFSGAEHDATVRMRSLGGRWFIWKELWDDFNNRILFDQLFGDGAVRNAHNNFLAVLLSGGLVGLVIYVVLLTAVAHRLIQNWNVERSPMNVMALMIFAMMFVDGLGSPTFIYTTYQWYVWGFIGLAIGLADNKRGARHLQPVSAIRRRL